ncbi:MAG TPA: histidine decarboxylase, pyruvoyl type, partial [Bacillota bacterium]|nr:histidine decarboxylase, pyruvoyl type [Bacillota bacterium]
TMGDYDLATVINGAVGSDKKFCMGYMNPGASGNGYITTIKLSVGYVDIDQAELQASNVPLDIGTSGIVSYDRCECNDAYIGGINMLTASSFTGLNGAVWGYDLAIADGLRDDLLYYETWKDGRKTPVYNIEPLLDAARRLFGVQTQRRFNPMPGSMVICANKNTTTPFQNPGDWVWAWSFIALSFVDGRVDQTNLFIEDCNYFDGNLPWSVVAQKLNQTMHAVTKCIVLCGEDEGIEYKETFLGFRVIPVPATQIGCALACAPYVTLAKNAIPAGMQPADVTKLSIGDWEKKLGLPPLPPMPEYQKGFLGKGGLNAKYGDLKNFK